MFRSRLSRSHSTDDLLNRTRNYSSSLGYDSSYRQSSFDYSDPLDYGQGFQSRYDRDFSNSSRFNEMDSNYYQRHPVKERRVTWALPEFTSSRNGLLSARSTRTHGTNTYGSSNPSCPIHGYDSHETPDRYNYDARSYNLRPTTSSLYDIRPSTRDLSSRYNSSLYGASEPKASRDYLRSSISPRVIPHRYSSFSNLKSPILNMGYYPSAGTDYRGTVNSLLTSQSNLRRPKWRRSIIGLNRWSMY